MESNEEFNIMQVLGIIETHLMYNPNGSEFEFYLALKLQLEERLKELKKIADI